MLCESEFCVLFWVVGLVIFLGFCVVGDDLLLILFWWEFGIVGVGMFELGLLRKVIFWLYVLVFLVFVVDFIRLFMFVIFGFMWCLEGWFCGLGCGLDYFFVGLVVVFFLFLMFFVCILLRVFWEILSFSLLFCELFCEFECFGFFFELVYILLFFSFFGIMVEVNGEDGVLNFGFCWFELYGNMGLIIVGCLILKLEGLRVEKFVVYLRFWL